MATKIEARGPGTYKNFSAWALVAGLLLVALTGVLAVSDTYVIIKIVGTAAAALGPTMIVGAWRERVWERRLNTLLYEFEVVTYSQTRIACAHQLLALILGPIAYWTCIVFVK